MQTLPWRRIPHPCNPISSSRGVRVLVPRTLVLRGASASHKVDDQADQGHDEEDVNQSARNVEREEARKPGHQQNHEENEKHDVTLLLLRMCVRGYGLSKLSGKYASEPLIAP